MRWKYVWKHRKNKILACTLSGLALAIFLAVQIVFILLEGANYFSFLNIWNLVITLAVYSIIFIGNLRNDPFAYNGILMFIFMVVFDAVRSFTYDVVDSFQSANIQIGLFFIVMAVFEAAMAVVGVLLYIRSRRYMSGLIGSWKKIRILSILFFAFLTLGVAFELAFLLLLGIYGPNYALLVSAGPVSEILIAGAIVFTMERLRRD